MGGVGNSRLVSCLGELQHVNFWVHELCAPKWIIDTISNGYTSPFFVESTPYKKANQYLAYVNADFVHKAISELVKGHFVEEVAELPYISSPLLVVENKKRLVVNLRHVNQFLWKKRLKYEDLRIAMMLFSPGELISTSSQGIIMWKLQCIIVSTQVLLV